MALPPTAAADPGAADTGNDMGDMMDNTGTEGAGGEQCVVSICKTPDGGYMVYAGDEPEEPGEGTAAEEGAEGSEAAEGEPQGQPAESIGQALKIAMDILQADENQGGSSALEEGFAGQGNMPAPPNPPGG